MAAAGLEAELLDLLTVFLLAAGVGVLVAKVGRFPYTIALLLAGLVVSVLGLPIDVSLSHDVILLVLLPPLLFQGAATTDLEELRTNLPPIVALAVPGLLLSIVLLGYVGQFAFEFPPLVALLFAAMILPTDPVSVLALFEELGAPDRLATLVEGESLLNDGVAVVIFSALLGLLEGEGGAETLLTPATLLDLGLGILVSSLGGLLVGLAAGYAVYRVMLDLDSRMTEIVLTGVLAYGSFLLAEHYLGVSGVIATVVAGLFMGNRGAEYAMSPPTKISIFNTWETAAFVVNTFIFLVIGITTPVAQLIAEGRLIIVAVVLVIFARAVAVYPVTAAINRLTARTNDVSLKYQHVMVWSGLHASIPIALVLGLPEGPYRTELRAMVFGVAAFSLVVQGLSISRLLDSLDIVTRSEAREIYELLIGRKRAVTDALSAAERLRDRHEISESVYQDFADEYGRELEDIDRYVARLFEEHPELRQEERRIGERQVLQREKTAIMDAVRDGTVSEDVGQRLLEEVDLKLDHVRAGDSTIGGHGETFQEFWRSRVDDFGLTPEPEESEEPEEPQA